MGFELIRRAICDRCGTECYQIVERTIDEEVCQQYKIERKRILSNVYHYTEVKLRGFDNRFGESEETTFVLCGDCACDLGEWLKHPNKHLQTADTD